MRKSVWFLSAGFMALATPAYAQDTEAAQDQSTDTTADDAAAQDDDGDVGAIVITATRRNEALSDVPLAVSAVTAETLKNSGADDIRALTQVSPSLLVSSTSSEAGAGGARIRGVGTVGDNPGLESSVAVFIDGVYRSRIGVGLTELGQVDRIEVLRGPQGTLFGRNASAGLLSVITAKPRFETEVSGAFTYGNYDTRRAEISATGPLGENVAGRIDGIYMKRDGFLKDVISGRRINDRDRYLFRGQLLYEPSSDLSVRFVADYSNRDEECCGATYLPVRDYTASGDGPSTFAGLERALGAIINDDTFKRETALTPGRGYRSDVEDYGASIETIYDFGGAELTSITAYRYNKYTRGQDADFNNLDILYRDDDGGAFNRFRTFTQELRLQGEAMDGKLDWLVGGYFAKENLRLKDNLTFGGDYANYANCLSALNFAGLTGQPGLVSPNSDTCFNPVVASGIRDAIFTAYLAAGDPVTQAALQQQAFALSAFARLGVHPLSPVNFGAAPFIDSGYSNIALALNPAAGLQTLDVTVDDNYNQRSTNWAIFTHNIFEITDKLDLTVGLRYTRERKKLSVDLNDDSNLCSFFSAAVASLQTLPCVVPATPGGNLSAKDKNTEVKLSGTVVLGFKPTDDILTYASYSRGYKAGGFNLDRTPLIRSNGNGAILPTTNLDALKFDPETNNAYELGLKYDGRMVDVNVAVFRQDFKAFQLNQFNGIAFEVENINSCSELDVDGGDTDASPLTGSCVGKKRAGVRSQGVEFELFSRPVRHVNVNFGATYVDTKYRHNIVGADGEAVSPQLFQLPGRRISNSNQLTLTGSFTWTPPIGDSGMTGLVYFDGRHSSKYNTGSDLDIEKIQKSYEVFNGRIGIRGPDEAWAVELWAQNLFNKDYIQVAFDVPLQGSNGSLATNTARGVDEGLYPFANQLFGAFLAEPRTYGVTVRGKF